MLILDPCQRPLFGASLERVPRGAHFHYLWIKFMMHSYMYFNPIIHFASHSLHCTSISFFYNFCSFWTPCQRPLFGGLLGEGPRGAHFHYFWIKISWYVHTFTSIRSFNLLLTHWIDQTSHFLQFFCSFWTPARDPCLGPPFGEGPRGAHFHYFWIKFMMHSYMYFNPIIHFSSNSLHWTSILFFLQFLLILDPLPETPVWGPPWRGSQRSSFFTTSE